LPAPLPAATAAFSTCASRKNTITSRVPGGWEPPSASTQTLAQSPYIALQPNTLGAVTHNPPCITCTLGPASHTLPLPACQPP
jgi:hypothetical protein